MKHRHQVAKEIQLRMTDQYEVDRFGSHQVINLVLDIIHEVELDHAGQSDQRLLSSREKYGLALFFMKLVEDPSKFPYIEKRCGGANSESIRLNL